MKKMALFVFILMTLAVFSGCLGGTPKKAEETITTDEGAGGVETGAPPVRGQADPIFKEYEYPGSKFDGSYRSGDILSDSYISEDDYDKVVEYYNQKFLRSPIMTGTTASFEKWNPDNSRITAGVTPLGDGTQIILAYSDFYVGKERPPG